MATGTQVEAYRQAQAKIEAEILDDLRYHWSKIKNLAPEAIRDDLVEFIPRLIESYGSISASVAADWFEELIGESAYVPDLYAPDTWAASTRWALSPLWDGVEDHGAAFAHLVSATVRHTRHFGRTVIDSSVRRHRGVLYARVPTGVHTCEFCLVLASRGPVYGDKTSAGDVGNKYHDDCDCLPVPMRGSWQPDMGSPRGVSWDGETVAGFDFERMYDEHYRPHWRENDSIKDVVARMRKERAAHAAVIGAQKGKLDWFDDGDHSREWAYRQAALVSNTNGEKLYAREIRFAERFEDLGERFVWINRPKNKDGKLLTSNDFVWVGHDGEYELKMPGADAKKMRNIIRKAAKIRFDDKQVKERFIIDLEDAKFTEKLRYEAQRYNVRMRRDQKPGSPSALIKELWVMSENGTKFEQVALK